MKKKLILGFVAVLFAAVTVVNTNLAMKVYNGDATLESIAVMAQAQSEETTPPPKDFDYVKPYVSEGGGSTRILLDCKGIGTKKCEYSRP